MSNPFKSDIAEKFTNLHVEKCNTTSITYKEDGDKFVMVCPVCGEKEQLGEIRKTS